MIYSIVLGVAIALIIFLALNGIDITPIIVLAAIGVGGFYLAKTKGVLPSISLGKGKTVDPSVEFGSIGGQDVAINELKEALDFILNQGEMSKLGIRPLKGILLTGPPGTGKTLLAKAAANYCDSVFVSSSGSEFVEMYAGVGAQRVRKLFQNARHEAKDKGKNNAVIFIDEIDVIGASRGRNSGHMEYDQTLNQLLVEMDGLKVDDSVRVLLLAATNRADILDPALLRPGRFDRQVKVPLPNKEGRHAILTLHTKNKPLASDVDLKELAKESYGFSGAMLESLTNEAAIYAMRDNQTEITMEHFRGAVEKVMIGEKLNKIPSQDELHRVAVHELGHALVSELVKPNSVTSISITPRGEAMGYVRQTPEHDIHLYTESLLRGHIDVCLAGAVAEKVILGDRSTGASNDYQQAVNLAQNMVMAGMSSLGIVSEATTTPEMLYRATQEVLSEEEGRVATMIAQHQAWVGDLVHTLIEHETLTGGQFRQMIDDNPHS